MKKILSRCQTVDAVRSFPRHPICVILENVRSLYDVGAVFRTADAACIEKLFLCGITGFPPDSEIAKTALGAQATVPWEHHNNTLDAISKLKQTGYQIVAVEQTDRSRCFWDVIYPEKVAFVFGYEVEGISDLTLSACDSAIDIPMFGYKGSLNVSIACGIVLYDALAKQSRASLSSIRN